jgi:DNA gyrase/topoisomerase IV subunit B
LLGFFKKYLPDYLLNQRFGELQTPVQAVMKNKKPIRWIYELGATLDLKPGESGKYYKGLGSWKSDDLQHVVKTDGIENMINLFDLDSADILDDWLNSDKADTRKIYISRNEFDITGV